MVFIDEIKSFSERISNLKNTIATEESTKMSLVVPFFQMLGYDVFNPTEFCPEYIADVGIKKGEKIDYAIIINDVPTILIECKWCGDNLDKHSSQLFRYFGTSPAKFGILTNGITYKFFTDLEENNKMDLTPFLEINLEDIRETSITELKKFSKETFDKDNIFSTASELKYSNLIKDLLKTELEEPSEDFIRFLLTDIYDGQKNQKVIEKFKPIIKKSFNGFINDTVNQKISSALTKDEQETIPKINVATDDSESESKIITTPLEMESFYIIKGILAGSVPTESIVYRDTESYFGILYQDNNRKPICRLNLDKKNKQLFIPDENKSFVRYYIESLNDIYQYKQLLIESAKRYL